MKFAIIVSKTDAAGLLIAEKFEEHSFDSSIFKLHFIEEQQVFADSVNNFSEDFFIFASKHKSESKKPTLTCHAIGNWGKAELGGKDKTLVPTSAVLNKKLIVSLEKEAKIAGLDWPIVAEVDHHGPYLTKPTVFVEVGSTEKEWKNEVAAEIVARAILDSQKIGGKFRVAIGFGGPHYCPNFSKILLNTDIALSHIAPKYALANLDFGLFTQMIEKTIEPVEFALIDWDGTNAEQRTKIISCCCEFGLNYQRLSDFL